MLRPTLALLVALSSVSFASPALADDRDGANQSAAPYFQVIAYSLQPTCPDSQGHPNPCGPITWHYDDPAKNVYGELLDGGIGSLIQQQLPGTTRAYLRFAAQPFTGWQMQATLIGPDLMGGADYLIGSTRFWLCGHLFDYFRSTPGVIYAAVLPIAPSTRLAVSSRYSGYRPSSSRRRR